MTSIQVDLTVSFTYVDGRFTPDLSWSEVQDAVTRATLRALTEVGLKDYKSIDISMRSERL